MIEEVVPPLAPSSLVSPDVVEPAVERSSNDLGRSGVRPFRTVGRPLTVRLPEAMMDELRWVADQEGCDVTEIVVNAVDEFLADHWVRNSDF
jgi:hypothetical protein